MSQKPSVYLAGPFRSKPDWNFPLFKQLGERWEQWGWRVFSPERLDKACQYSPEDGTNLQHVIQMDLACVQHADAIAMLPDWEMSSGSNAELSLAIFLGKQIFDAESGVLLEWHRSGEGGESRLELLNHPSLTNAKDLLYELDQN